MPSNHLILCRPLLLLPSVFPSIRVFSNESALHIRWPKYWSFSFNISPANEHPGLISFRIDWLDLLAVQGTLKSLLQHHSSKESILLYSPTVISIHAAAAAAAAKSLQLCLTLCNPIDSSPPGSPVPGILQARTLEWVTISCPMHESETEVTQSCQTLLDPIDCSPPGSSPHGIFQARVLEWVTIAFSIHT